MSTLRKSYSLLRSDISLPVMCHHGEWSLPHVIRSMSLLSWSRVPESQMGRLMHTLLLHSFEAPRTKLVQPWGPVRLSLQWVWLWVGVGSVMSLQSWGLSFRFFSGFWLSEGVRSVMSLILWLLIGRSCHCGGGQMWLWHLVWERGGVLAVREAKHFFSKSMIIYYCIWFNSHHYLPLGSFHHPRQDTRYQ